MSDPGSVPGGFEDAARAALGEITPRSTIGALEDVVRHEDGVVDLAFASLLDGYVGWRWTASLVQLPDALPSVLEVELLPGDGSLVPPAWVPWEERLAEYRRTHPDDLVDGAEEDPDGGVEGTTDEDEDDAEEDDDLDAEVDDLEIDGVDFEESSAVGEGEPGRD